MAGTMTTITAAQAADLWEKVLTRYDARVRAGQGVAGDEFGALFVTALPDIDPRVDLEAAAAELEARIRRYHLDVCLDHVQARDGVRPSERLLSRCFKGWPVSPKVMVRKLLTPETRRKKGKPVHGTTTVDLAGALFDRIHADAEAEVEMSRARLMPEPADVRCAAHDAAVPVLAALLRTAGLRHRQIAQLLAAMGALKDGSAAAQEKAVQRAALDGELRLAGEPAPKRRSLAYAHHPILEFLIGEEPFLELLANDADAAGALLAAAAPDLRAMKVRMALVDFSPTVVNAFRTLDRDEWPPVLQQLSDQERQVLLEYGAERLSRTDAELALGRRGAAEGAPLMRPMWRMFVASSLTRMALQSRADVQDVLRELTTQEEAVDQDLTTVPAAQRELAEDFVAYVRAYLWLDRVDLSLLAAGSLDEARHALAEATAAAAGHARVQHDLLLRELSVEVKANLHLPMSQLADAVDRPLRAFVRACDSGRLATDNLRQYLAPLSTGAARVLAERSAQLDASTLPTA